MCLALPARVSRISDDGETATVELGGVARDVSLALVEDVSVGDFVLIHVGYALNKVSEDEAMRTLELFAEAGIEEAIA
jgi:hydrogenase expression/formation protein HypC